MMTIIYPTFTAVDSSAISDVAYFDGDVWVKYKSGCTYKYKFVPVEVYEQFMSAESKGKFLNAVIKPNYDYDYVR